MSLKERSTGFGVDDNGDVVPLEDYTDTHDFPHNNFRVSHGDGVQHEDTGIKDVPVATETPEEKLDRRLDEEADKLGSYRLARQALGIEPEAALSKPKQPSLPGKPVSYQKSGHVRVFHDLQRTIPHGVQATEPFSQADLNAKNDGVQKAQDTLAAGRKEPTPEEVRAQREKDGAELVRKARESWAQFDQ